MIQLSTVVRNLGVLFESELSMKQHVAKVAATRFYVVYARFVDVVSVLR